jgi:mevalonate pyrophosphate decarboxylase
MLHGYVACTSIQIIRVSTLISRRSLSNAKKQSQSLCQSLAHEGYGGHEAYERSLHEDSTNVTRTSVSRGILVLCERERDRIRNDTSGLIAMQIILKTSFTYRTWNLKFFAELPNVTEYLI